MIYTWANYKDWLGRSTIQVLISSITKINIANLRFFSPQHIWTTMCIFNIYSIGIGEDWIVNSNNNNNNNNNNNKNKNSYNNSSFDNFPHWNLTKLDGW